MGDILSEMRKQHPQISFVRRVEGKPMGRDSLLTYWDHLIQIGKLCIPAFIIDDDNSFVYKNLMLWALADPSCKAIDPETAKEIPADLNKGIFISGKTGTGKSVALEVLREFVREVRDRGFYINGICENLTWTNFRADDIVDRFCEGESLRWMKKAAMLGIQDLGSEPTEAIYMGNRHELLRLILESRADYSTVTLVTSNFAMLAPELRKKYGDRVQSRCREMFNYYVLGGEDRRVNKKGNQEVTTLSNQ
ncbi:MAG: hypothetical protein E7069_03765 [Bacteroidales bacterium]|nr:hypothetical protein [Bacteroidales bacterium]